MRKRKGGLIGRFIKLVLALVLGFSLAAGVMVFALSKTGIVDITNTPLGTITNVLGGGLKVNIAVLGVDAEQTRTDVIFVVNFDSAKKKASLVSVPRDTRVDICDTARIVLDETGNWYPDYCKMNEVHAYAGKKEGARCAMLQLEDLLGVKIDHYVKINLGGFRAVVDMIGGVEMDVPQDMYYVDPYQDLYIDLKAGRQILDGEAAEQLVRFRSYPQGDVQRVEVQQLFLDAFIKKVLDPKTMIMNLKDYISAAYEYVETDITLKEALKYATHIDDIDTDNITMETIPGSGQYIGNVSYFVSEKGEVKRFVDELFYGEENNDTGKSYDLKIEIANGGEVNGLAAKNSDLLTDDGYNVIRVLNFTGDKTAHTRIFTREEGQGEDLKFYYPEAMFEADPTLIADDADILIILGTDEK